MRIRTKKDVEELDHKIKAELNIDIQKYRNDEVVQDFVELLIFPRYVINWVIRPLLISVLIFVFGFFILDLVHIEYLIYGIIGFVLFLANGILFGLLFLMWKIKSDLWGIIDYSLEIMKSIVYDSYVVNNQINEENKKDVLSLLFKGVIHIITIPMISKVISEKIPLIAGIVKRIVKQILSLVSDKIKFNEENLKQELDIKNEKPNALKVYTNSIISATKGLEKVLNFTLGIAQFPLKIVFGILFLVLALFLYLIN